jgi:hypothetical protein
VCPLDTCGSLGLTLTSSMLACQVFLDFSECSRWIYMLAPCGAEWKGRSMLSGQIGGLEKLKY